MHVYVWPSSNCLCGMINHFLTLNFLNRVELFLAVQVQARKPPWWPEKDASFVCLWFFLLRKAENFYWQLWVEASIYPKTAAFFLYEFVMFVIENPCDGRSSKCRDKQVVSNIYGGPHSAHGVWKFCCQSTPPVMHILVSFGSKWPIF